MGSRHDSTHCQQLTAALDYTQTKGFVCSTNGFVESPAWRSSLVALHRATRRRHKEKHRPRSIFFALAPRCM